MNKKDEATNEVKKAQEQQAATMAAGSYATKTKSIGKFAMVLMSVSGLLLVACILLLSNVFGSRSTLEQQTTVYVEQVQDLATLATAEAHVKVVLNKKDNQLFGKDIPLDLPGTKREILLIVPATVIAGVDLGQVQDEDFQVDADNKQLNIKLPRATFMQEPAIDMDAVQTFSDEGLFRSEVKWDEGFDLAAQAQEQIIEEATATGLLQRAEDNAATVLASFFSKQGYEVHVTFQ